MPAAHRIRRLTTGPGSAYDSSMKQIPASLVMLAALSTGAGLAQAQTPASAPSTPAQAGPPRGFQQPRGPQTQVARTTDLMQMMAALPDSAPATPKKPRRVLVL